MRDLGEIFQKFRKLDPDLYGLDLGARDHDVFHTQILEFGEAQAHLVRIVRRRFPIGGGGHRFHRGWLPAETEKAT